MERMFLTETHDYSPCFVRQMNSDTDPTLESFTHPNEQAKVCDTSSSLSLLSSTHHLTFI